MRSLQPNSVKKTALAAAIVVALGVGTLPQSALATQYTFSFAGSNKNLFTMIGAGGTFTNNADLNAQPVWNGNRTPISGSITYDTATSTGTMVINPFSFFGAGTAIATTITLQAIGNGDGNPASGNLILGNMGFNWNGNNGIPVSVLWDATGFLAAVNGPIMSPGNTVTTGGVLPASDNTDTVVGAGGTTYPIGPAVIATATYDTTTIGTPVLGTNPSGTLPLVTDTVVDGTNGDVGIGGSPMPTAPFPGFNANFDFTNLLVTCVDANCGQGSVINTTPPTGSAPTALVTVTFSLDMKADTVASAFTLVNVTAGNTAVPGTLTPNGVGVLATTFTFTPNSPLDFSTQYQANVSSAARDKNDAALASAPANTWTFTTAAQPQFVTCTGGGPQPLGGNFTMLNPKGTVFGGTNDITYNLDFSNLNTSVTGTAGISTNTLASALPQPFFGFIWTAHDIRLFAPGDYLINVDCSSGQLQAGTCTSNADPSKNIAMHVGAGQIGAHMLFDWNGNLNIDVVDVWDQNAVWQQADPTINGLWTGEKWAGPAGFTVNPATTWRAVTSDSDGDGFNGVKMIDGPFIGYMADFNLSASDSCTAQAVPYTTAPDVNKVSGCSLGASNVDLTERGDWWFVAGFLAWLGLIRKRLARQRS
jgi:hypothetical protein